MMVGIFSSWNFIFQKSILFNLDLSPISVLETQTLIGLNSKGLLADHNFRQKSKEIVLLNITLSASDRSDLSEEICNESNYIKAQI